MNNVIRFSALGLLALAVSGCSNFCLRDTGNSTDLSYVLLYGTSVLVGGLVRILQT